MKLRLVLIGIFGWLSFGVAQAVFTYSSDATPWQVFVVALCVILAALVFRSDANKAKAAELRRETFTRMISPTGGMIYYDENTAIAVNTADQRVAFRKGNTTRAYSFSDVRGWEVRDAAPDFALSGGSLGAGHNIASLKYARENTGLFVRVKDINFPEWHVTMFDKRDRDRWFEILTQTINEGALTPAP